MKHKEMIEKLPGAMNRTIGRGKGSRDDVEIPDDLETLAQFQDYAMQNAVKHGEFWGKGFKQTVPESPGFADSPRPMLDPKNPDQVISHINGLIESDSLPEPTKADASTEQKGESGVAEKPREFVEWIPIAVMLGQLMIKLIAKWKRKNK